MRRGTCEQANTHHEQVLVDVQVSVAVSTLVLDGLGEHGTLVVRASLSAPSNRRSPETPVEGHADSVEAPGEFVPRRSEATDAQLDRLRKPAAVGLAGGGAETESALKRLLRCDNGKRTKGEIFRTVTLAFFPSVFVLNC